jgi:hypothetical protein
MGVRPTAGTDVQRCVPEGAVLSLPLGTDLFARRLCIDELVDALRKGFKSAIPDAGGFTDDCRVRFAAEANGADREGALVASKPRFLPHLTVL